MPRGFWLLFLTVWLTACSVRPVPRQVTLTPDGFGRLEVHTGGAWSVASPGWLAAAPASGSGGGVVYLEGDGRRLPDRPAIEGTLTVSAGGLYPVRVRWPLLKLTLRLEAGPPAAPLAARPLVRPRPPRPRGKLVKLAGGRWVRLPAGAPTPAGALREEADGYVWPLGFPADPFFPYQWHLRQTGARWAFLKDYVRPVVVAVIDTGVRYDHPDLAGVLLDGTQGAYDFTENDPDPTDTGGHGTVGSHGTHVAGIVAARADGVGVVGEAWPAPVRVLPLRVIDASGYGRFSDVADAIRYAAGLPVTRGSQTLENPSPAQVINLSLGSTQFSQALCDAVADAVRAGAAVVAAAGNLPPAPGAYFYPAACPGAIAVAATDQGVGRPPRPAWYTAQNDRVAVAAPGGDLAEDADADGHPDGVLSTTWNYRDGRPSYGLYVGTSQAAPQVAAALALLLSSGEAATPAGAWNRLRTGLTDLGPPGRDPAYGFGFLNLTGALGIAPLPGRYRVTVEGRTGRSYRIRPGDPLATYLPAGAYRVTVCRDDGQNGLCDPGEPAVERTLALPGPGALTLPTP